MHSFAILTLSFIVTIPSLSTVAGVPHSHQRWLSMRSPAHCLLDSRSVDKNRLSPRGRNGYETEKDHLCSHSIESQAPETKLLSKSSSSQNSEETGVHSPASSSQRSSHPSHHAISTNSHHWSGEHASKKLHHVHHKSHSAHHHSSAHTPADHSAHNHSAAHVAADHSTHDDSSAHISGDHSAHNASSAHVSADHFAHNHSSVGNTASAVLSTGMASSTKVSSPKSQNSHQKAQQSVNQSASTLNDTGSPASNYSSSSKKPQRYQKSNSYFSFSESSTTSDTSSTVNEMNIDPNSGFHGKATFFLQGGAAGACGKVHEDTDYIVAIQSSMYDGGKYCGKTILVTRKSTGQTIKCIAADACPGCPTHQSLDLSVGAFNALGNPDEGVFDIQWSVLD